MASVINRTTLEYKESVNTPDYPTEDWIISPDLTNVSSIDKKYWKVVGDTVVEMTQIEKDAVDATEAAAIPATDVSGVWLTAAPANDTEAITRMAAALKSMLGRPID